MAPSIHDHLLLRGSLECHMHMYLEQQVLVTPSSTQAKATAQLWSRVQRGKRSVHKDLDPAHIISPQLASRLKLDHGFTTRFNYAHLVHALIGPGALDSPKRTKETLKWMVRFIEGQDATRDDEEALQKCFLVWFSLVSEIDSTVGHAVRGISAVDSYVHLPTFYHQDWRLDDSVSVASSPRSTSRPLEEDLVARTEEEEDDWPRGEHYEMDAHDYVSHDDDDDGDDGGREIEASPVVTTAEEDIVQHTTSTRSKSGASANEPTAVQVLEEVVAAAAAAGSARPDPSRPPRNRTVIVTRLSSSKRRTADEIEDSEFEDDNEVHEVGPLKKRVRKVQLELPMDISLDGAAAAGPSNIINPNNSISGSGGGGQARAIKTEARQYTHWSREELQRLKDLVPRFKPPETKMWGKRRVEVNWSQLKRYDDTHGAILGSRSQVQLKDKWRHLSKTKE
ncbi:hypothetical protein DFQ27_005407 [Actinomortierella ambigua]|uniref:Myb-like domain-containing protein n=1 Tax=Actinomortierella ambigua TaxID=1343610 RepID=A0A9P6U1W0_9FUNG|nr:hypothetical protein DFQ27_005407 [Actinomortierella ambigua]